MTLYDQTPPEHRPPTLATVTAAVGLLAGAAAWVCWRRWRWSE